ncbi:hypothetical protein GWI33_003335, partial [Rhynchophorus ferrugineus]
MRVEITKDMVTTLGRIERLILSGMMYTG